MTQSEKATFWQDLINEQQESGQSVAAFCREWDLPEWKFYYWRRRPNKNELQQAELSPASNFMELTFDKPAINVSGLKLRLGKIEIDVQSDFDAHCLNRVLEVLEAPR